MSNWTAITISDLLANARSEFILTAQSQSLGGGNDPVAEVIGNTTADIRAAVSLGGALDIDPTKIPNSLKTLCIRICCRTLKGRIPVPLTEDEIDDKRSDEKWLQQIVQKRLTFETPDDAGGDAEMQASQYTDIATSSDPFTFSRCGMEGLL